MLRGRAVPAGTDEPYAPILRAIRPTLLAATDDELVELLGPGIEDGLRLVPELHTRLARTGTLPERLTVTSPERRQARLLEGILGVLIRMGERRPVALVIEDLHHADAGTRAFATFLARVQRPRRVCLIVSFQPDEVTRSHPLTGELAEDHRGPPAAGAPAARAARPRRAGRPHRGDRGRAPDRLRARPRRRAQPRGSRSSRRRCWPPAASSRARRCRSALEDLVIARLGLRSPECRRVLRLLAPAARPLTMIELADVAAAYERTADHRPPPRSSSAPRRGEGPIDADLAAGLDEAVEHGVLTVADDAVDFRHELIGRAVVADLLPGQRHRHHLALAAALVGHPAAAAHHWDEAHATTQARDAAIDAAGRAEAVYSPQDALETLELALSSVAPAAANGETDAGIADDHGPGVADDPLDASPLQMRAAEAAFAAGRSARAAGLRRDRDQLASTSAATASRSGCCTSGWAATGARSATATARSPRCERAVSLVPAAPSVERATRAGRRSPRSAMLDGTFSEAESLAREAIADRDGVRARRPTPIGSTRRRRSASSLGWGEDPEAGVALLREALGLAAEIAATSTRLFRVYANLTTVLDLVGRREEAVDGRVRGRRGDAAGGPRGGLRQLPARQRRGLAVPARPLGRVAGAQRDRPRVEPGRGRRS